MKTNPDEYLDVSNMNHGLTKREYFAAKAMQGLLSAVNNASAEQITHHAVACADALITELNKETT